VTAQRMSRERVDRDFGLLADRHVGQLRLLVIRNDPYLRHGGQRRDLGSDSDELSGFYLTLSENAVLGCNDPRVFQVEPGNDQRGAGGGERSLVLLELPVEDREVTLGGESLCLVLGQLRIELRVQRLELLACLGR